MKRPNASRPHADSHLPLMPRVFAVLSAVLIVGSVAMASLLPDQASLGQVIHMLDPSASRHLQAAIASTLGQWAWAGLFVPFLVRPVWLIPVCLGIICAGGAVTALTHVSARAKQKRS